VDFHVTTAQELQNALTLAAANGADDTISLGAGYYTGNFNFTSTENRSLVLQGEPGTTNTDITIDGAGTGRDMNLANTGTGNFTVKGITFLRDCGDVANAALRIVGGNTSTVLVESCRFLTPTNTSGLGVGLEIASGQDATVTNCLAIGKTGTGLGVGVGILIRGVSGNVAVGACTFSMNSGPDGNGGYAGGLYVGGAAASVVEGNSFSDNGNTGAGAVVTGGRITFLNNRLTRNNGGAALTAGIGYSVLIAGNNFTGNRGAEACRASASNGPGSIVMSNNVILGNSSSYTVGDAFIQYAASATVAGNTFSGNSNTRSDGNGGAGLYCSVPATITGNSFVGNTSSVRGGGVVCASDGSTTIADNTFTGNSAGQGGGLYCSYHGTFNVTGNTFTGNSGGGAVFAFAPFNASTVTVSANIFKQNFGGGFTVSATTVNLLGNLVAKNTQGGGIYVNPFSMLTMINNTVSDNASGGNGGGLACSIGGTSEVLDVYNNIIWGNSAAGNGADVWLAGTGSRKTFRYNAVHGMYGVWDIADNLLDVAPAFFDPVNGDYHLRVTSPCLDAGTNGAPSIPALDLDGNIRTNGVAVDLGCYEFNNTVFHPADVNQDWSISATEYANYAAAWKNSQPWPVAPAQVPADYVTRAGYFQAQGGTYHNNDGAGAPLCWKPGTN
jgi:hypothetical protein